MLNSLEIRNYRNLRHLTIEKLGRVNLLVGKNNTGKTSVLEAIGFYINKGSLFFLLQLLEERGENYIRRNSKLTEEDIIKTITAIFTNRKAGYTYEERISIRDVQHFINPNVPEVGVFLRLLKFIETVEPGNNSHTTRINRIPVEEDNLEAGIQLGIEVGVGVEAASRIIPLSFFERNPSGRLLGTESSAVNYQFVRTKNIDRDINSVLWDEITLTDKEEIVIKALQIIDRDVERVAFISRNERVDDRIPVVRLKGSSEIVPLRSMGDGINRIFTIILAMVNCENGYLLIDEFENGLHYSVQEQLWETVFYLSKQINIQVFATTHSNDTIKAFGEVANLKPDYDDAQLIRLRNIKGDISAVLFNSHDIEIANETDYIDLR